MSARAVVSRIVPAHSAAAQSTGIAATPDVEIGAREPASVSFGGLTAGGAGGAAGGGAGGTGGGGGGAGGAATVTAALSERRRAGEVGRGPRAAILAGGRRRVRRAGRPRDRDAVASSSRRTPARRHAVQRAVGKVGGPRAPRRTSASEPTSAVPEIAGA